MSPPRPTPADAQTIEQVLRYLDRALPPGEVAALGEELRDGEQRRRVAGLLLSLGQLGELGRQARAEQPQLQALKLHVSPPRRSGRRWLAAGLGLGAVLALIVALRRGRDPERDGASTATVAGRAAGSRNADRGLRPPAFQEAALAGRVEALAGSAQAFVGGRRQPVDLGTRIGSGSGVETVGREGRATLLLDDGSRLELGGASRLGVLETGGGPSARGRAVLEAGDLAADIAPYPGAAPYLVVAGAFELRAQAARYRLGVAGGVSLRLDVRRGQVDVRRTSDGQTLTVHESESALLTESSVLAAAPVPRPVALLVHGPDDARCGPMDRTMTRRLEELGFTVAPVRDSDLSRQALAGKAVVVISSTALAGVVRERVPAAELPTADVPVVCCEPGALPPLGMTSSQGTAPVRLHVVVDRPSHPLAAGLTGQVQVARDFIEITWGRPGPGAVSVATLDDGRPVSFAYERGAAMARGIAPARRASCFLDPDRIALVNESGWQLFDAAVRWASSAPR